MITPLTSMLTHAFSYFATNFSFLLLTFTFMQFFSFFNLIFTLVLFLLSYISYLLTIFYFSTFFTLFFSIVVIHTLFIIVDDKNCFTKLLPPHLPDIIITLQHLFFHFFYRFGIKWAMWSLEYMLSSPLYVPITLPWPRVHAPSKADRHIRRQSGSMFLGTMLHPPVSLWLHKNKYHNKCYYKLRRNHFHDYQPWRKHCRNTSQIPKGD